MLSWAAKVPVVLAVRKLPRSGIPAVAHDDRSGARLAAEHLASLGHRRVAQVPGPLDVQPFKDRRESFIAAAEQLGLDVVTTPAAIRPTFDEGLRLMADHLASGGRRFTAVFAHNDQMAFGAKVSPILW